MTSRQTRSQLLKQADHRPTNEEPETNESIDQSAHIIIDNPKLLIEEVMKRYFDAKFDRLLLFHERNIYCSNYGATEQSTIASLSI